MNRLDNMIWYCLLILTMEKIYAEECLLNKWPSETEAYIPTYVVDLDTSPLVRWNHIATLYKSQIRDLLNYTKTFLVNIGPMFAYAIDLLSTKLPQVVDSLPEPYGDELKGISQASGIPLSDIILYNIFYEVSSLCTSIVAQDHNGNVFHGRNLDFGLFLGWDQANKTWIMTHKLRPLVISINYIKNGQVRFRATSFAGFIGLVTGIKPGMFSITLNTRFDLNGGYIGVIEWIYNLDRQQSFITFAIRDMLTNTQTYDDVVEHLSKIPLLAPCYYILAGSQPGQGAIITRSRKETLDIQKLDPNNNQDQWFLIQRNVDHWIRHPLLDNALSSVIQCLQNQGNTNLTFQSLFNLLSSRPFLNKLTIYTTLIQPSTNSFESYLQSCHDEDHPCSLW